MAYIDGFVIAVPTANQQQFIAHAHTADSVFIEHGATRTVEAWGTDVPKGKTTDFQCAVAAEDDETVVFSWIEWPDKATRDGVMGRMAELEKSDERLNQAKNPMPFDGKRQIYGGFEPIVECGEAASDSYIQGFVIPVPKGKREAYRKMAEDAWRMFKGHGALRVVEAWADDVPEGKVTDFRRAVKAGPDEAVVFSFMEWPSREVCDAAQKKMMADDSMTPPEGTEWPFDGKRLIYGGFTRVVTLSAISSVAPTP